MKTRTIVEHYYTTLDTTPHSHKCLCGKEIIQRRDKGYTNLLNHIKSAHPNYFEEVSAAAETSGDTENKEFFRQPAFKRQKTGDDSEMSGEDSFDRNAQIMIGGNETNQNAFQPQIEDTSAEQELATKAAVEEEMQQQQHQRRVPQQRLTDEYEEPPEWFEPALYNVFTPLLHSIQAEMRQLRTDIAKVNNRSSAMNDHPIMPVPANPFSSLPADFPKTLGELRNISLLTLDNALNYYQMSQNGTKFEKRQRLAKHLDVRHL